MMLKTPPIGDSTDPNVSVTVARPDRRTTIVSLFRIGGLFVSLMP
jgi:hypothetical protein